MRKLAFALSLFLSLSLFAQEDQLDVARQTIDNTNAYLESVGSDMRIVKASFFVRGHGMPDFRSLRLGVKWPYRTLTYVVDGDDMTTDVPAAAAAATIVNAYDTWNAVQNANVTTVQIPDDGTNFDVLDGTFHPVTGQCLTLVDITSANFNPATGVISTEADIVVGGWEPASYFSRCFGSNSILGVTLVLGSGDSNGDNYTDTLYAEQLYNEGFTWVLNGAQFLGPTEDIETVVLHENGHALGLDHTGGPNANQPFKIQPNGRVFDPEAVMNPFYLGGEKRSLFPIDVAALRALYTNPQ